MPKGSPRMYAGLGEPIKTRIPYAGELSDALKMARKGDNYADIAKMLMKVDDAKAAAKAAAIGIVSELGSQQIESVFHIANEAGSVARKLMKNYTDIDTKLLNAFFDELIAAVIEIELGG